MTRWFQAQRQWLAPAALALTAVVASGCTQDQHRYRSTQFSPKTVHVIDSASQENIWTMPIPVGHDLVISLKDEGKAHTTLETYAQGNPDYFTWKLIPWENGKSIPVDKGRVELANNQVTLDLEIRPAPEAYQEYVKAETAAGQALATPEADETLPEADTDALETAPQVDTATESAADEAVEANAEEATESAE